MPKGELHSPYPDYAKLAKDDPDLVKQFRLPGCNECHGGGGGGGICPALTQGVWFWGNTDDVLFRLVTLGSVDLEKQGYKRLSYGTVHAPMPPMGATIKSARTSFGRSSPSFGRSILPAQILRRKCSLEVVLPERRNALHPPLMGGTARYLQRAGRKPFSHGRGDLWQRCPRTIPAAEAA